MEISKDAKAFIEEQFGGCGCQEDVCKLYAEYMEFLNKQMSFVLKALAMEDE